jgi:hypothetical protein
MQLLLRIPRTRFFVLQGGVLPPFNRFSLISQPGKSLSVVSLLYHYKSGSRVLFSICQRTLSLNCLKEKNFVVENIGFEPMTPSLQS